MGRIHQITIQVDLDRDLVNPAIVLITITISSITTLHVVLVGLHVRRTESAGTVAVENQLFELLGLLDLRDPDPEQPNSTNRMRPS